MKIAHKLSASRKLFVNRTLVLAIAAPILFGIASATPGRAQSKPEILAATTPTYEYEVASIKLSKPAGANGMFMGMRYTDDGLTAQNLSLMFLIQQTYGVGKDRITGAPDWLNSERYDIDAKMDPALADEIQKLGSGKSQPLRQQMLQALLADRFKLKVSHESKELAVYFLVVAKNGPKLQETKPGYVGPNDFDGPDGNRATDSVTITRSGTVMGQAASVATLASTLSRQLGRPVLDKTELTGRYDFTFKFAPDRIQSVAPPESVANGQPLPAPPDPTGPSLMDAIQVSLGLKLESGKGPFEIFVIDRVERPSGN